MSKREVVVLSGIRTPIGTFGGSLKDIPPTDLALACVHSFCEKIVFPCLLGRLLPSSRGLRDV